MPASRRGFRLGLQAKVLVVVTGFLVVLPLLTVWIVGNSMQRQMEDEALRTLTTAESVFLKSLDNRSRNVLTRFRSVVDEARFRVTAELGDRKTIEGLLGNVLEDSPEDHEVLLFFDRAGELVAGRRRASSIDLVRFSNAAETVTREALAGEAGVRSMGVDGRAYSLVSVPVLAANGGELLGALSVGVRIGESTVKELKLPRTETLLVDGGQVVVSTAREVPDSLLQEAITPGRWGSAMGGRDVLRVVVAGEHFMARPGALDPMGPAEASLRYVMLSSYELRLRALEETRRTLVELSMAAIVMSALVVSWLVRRLTRPLRELRDTAEAVGRGDFSRRIERFSNDECGDLAETFNRMTGNLRDSHAELQKAVETLENTQTQLIQSEKLSAVGQFVAGVAHELNNPLTAVIGFSDLLSHSTTDPKMRPQLDIIAKSAHRCHKIVQSLLSFARQHPPERKLIRINEIIDEVLEIMAYDFRTSNLKVFREYQENLPVITADAHQLQQVFINILSNARQAVQPFRPDGQLILRTRAIGPWLRLEFQDNGPGIRPEHLSRIFDPFFTTKPVGKGTGLGMSLSYGIVNEHGGKISVLSEVGQGATFVIELPIAVDRTAFRHGVDLAGLRESRPPVPAGKSVLVVDDEEPILNLTEALLREQGYGVEAVASGELAVERLANRKFDVIVCDWKMPGLSGIQLYEHLCARDAASASRMLFMTGDVISDTFQDFLVRRAKICLSKPFAIDDFRGAVAKMAAAVNQ